MSATSLHLAVNNIFCKHWLATLTTGCLEIGHSQYISVVLNNKVYAKFDAATFNIMQFEKYKFYTSVHQAPLYKL